MTTENETPAMTPAERKEAIFLLEQEMLFTGAFMGAFGLVALVSVYLVLNDLLVYGTLDVMGAIVTILASIGFGYATLKHIGYRRCRRSLKT